MDENIKKEDDSMKQEMTDQHRVKGLNGKKLKKIREQMEFYFSDANLQKDRLLGQLIRKDDQGYVDAKVFLTFNKIRAITSSVDDVLKAVSWSKLLETNSRKTKIHRKIPFQFDDEAVDAKTVYVEKIPSHADHRYLRNIFQRFGKVAYVSVPRFRNSNKCKGFAFIQFESEESVAKACESSKGSSDDESDDDMPSPNKLKEHNERHNAPRKNIEKSKSNGNIMEKKIESVEKDSEESMLTSQITSDTKRAKKRKRQSIETETSPSKKLRETDIKIEAISTKEELDEKIDNVPLLECETETLSAPCDTPSLFQVDELSVMDNSVTIPEDGLLMKVETVEPSERKKRRRRKVLESDKLKFRVLSMKEWKVYRNKYLTMQRKAMKAVKQMLLLQSAERWQPETKTKEEDGVEQNVEESGTTCETTPKSGIQEGVIVKMTIPQSCKLLPDEMKRQIKSSFEDLVYFDHSSLCNSEVYMRFASPETALKVTKSDELKKMGSFQVISGEEEIEYWKKIEADKINQRNRPRPKRRGRERIKAKATRVLEERRTQSHIYFD